MKFLIGTLIGYYVEIVYSSNRNYVGIKGLVVDETRNMLHIKINGRVLKVIKKACTFKVKIDGKECIIKGNSLVGNIAKRVVIVE